MLRKNLLILALVFVAGLAAAVMYARQAPQGGQGGQGQREGQRGGGAPQQQAQMIQQVKPGLYIVTGAGGNTGVRVTNDGLIVTDTKNLGDQFYNGLMEQIKTVSDKPVKYVFITHVHQDHSGNIGPFEKAGAQVIAHENLKKILETGWAGTPYPAPTEANPNPPKPASPNVTYTKDRVVKLGGVEVRGYYFGRAHTGGDTIVYYPDLKVVETGDIVVGTAPNWDWPNGGSLLEGQKVLASILKLDFDTVIPGHSAPGQTTMSKADLQAFKMKVDTFAMRAKDLVKKGTPKAQLLAQIKTDDLGWNLTTPQWTGRLDAFYDELSKAK